ncbi:unnamed protein product [Zymoseptoria tritici ST99CH_3D7]|uniref:Uncharacterized protein n=1 Tax=Zymoseptoria tritici (strain ST99CH_3D7) TaxID=1276538 RepID=A0A1X7RCY1_ZYMT9|nr:unnamed protein product [Zymoseptoria tritici ST99CH_3D7]
MHQSRDHLEHLHSGVQSRGPLTAGLCVPAMVYPCLVRVLSEWRSQILVDWLLDRAFLSHFWLVVSDVGVKCHVGGRRQLLWQRACGGLIKIRMRFLGVWSEKRAL